MEPFQRCLIHLNADSLSAKIRCHPGIEPILSEELNHHNLRHKPIKNGMSLSSVTVDQLMSCCLHLGSASQIYLVLLPAYKARGWDEMLRKIRKMDWQYILSPNVKISVKAKSSKSKLYHTKGIEERIQATVQEAMGTHSQDAHEIELSASLYRDHLELSMAAYTEPLHKRGYRQQGGKAPLREDLAYTMLWKAGLRPGSSKSQTIIDPFCGSGTIAIEAASILDRRPPGRLKNCPWRGTKLFRDDDWLQLQRDFLPLNGTPDSSVLVYASDRDEGAIKRAKSNARTAGVNIDLQCCAFSSHPLLQTKTPPQNDRTLLISNLPFGQRTTISRPVSGGSSKIDPMIRIYQQLHKMLVDRSKLQSISVAILSNNHKLFQSVFPADIPLRFNLGAIPTFLGTTVFAINEKCQ